MKRTASAEPSPPPLIIPAIPKQDVPARLAALPDADIHDLKQQWRSLFGTEPPPYNRRFLESRLAYRIQELAYGGLKPETIARLEALGEQIDGGNITLRRIRQDQRPIAGTRLRPTPAGKGRSPLGRAGLAGVPGRPRCGLRAQPFPTWGSGLLLKRRQ